MTAVVSAVVDSVGLSAVAVIIVAYVAIVVVGVINGAGVCCWWRSLDRQWCIVWHCYSLVMHAGLRRTGWSFGLLAGRMYTKQSVKEVMMPSVRCLEYVGTFWGRYRTLSRIDRSCCCES